MTFINFIIANIGNNLAQNRLRNHQFLLAFLSEFVLCYKNVKNITFIKRNLF